MGLKKTKKLIFPPAFTSENDPRKWL